MTNLAKLLAVLGIALLAGCADGPLEAGGPGGAAGAGGGAPNSTGGAQAFGTGGAAGQAAGAGTGGSHVMTGGTPGTGGVAAPGTGGVAGSAALPMCEAYLHSTVTCYTNDASGKTATIGYYHGAICTRCGVVLYTCALPTAVGDDPQVCVQSCDSCTDWH